MRGRTRRKLADPRSLLETTTALADSTCFLSPASCSSDSARPPGGASAGDPSGIGGRSSILVSLQPAPQCFEIVP